MLINNNNIMHIVEHFCFTLSPLVSESPGAPYPEASSHSDFTGGGGPTRPCPPATSAGGHPGRPRPGSLPSLYVFVERV